MIYVKQKIYVRGPWRTKKCSPSPSVALTVLRGQKWCSSWPFVDSKRCSPRPPPRPSVSSADKKGVLPDPSWPFADKKKLFSAPLRGPPCPPRTKKVFSPTPRGPSRTKKLFSAPLRGPPCPPRTKKMFSPPLAPLRGQSNTLPLQSQFTQTPTTPNLYPARKVRPPSDP